MQFGVRFFNLVRDLTDTEIFTSQLGGEDLDYQGNRVNIWDGVPEHGLSYDQKTLDEYVKEDERNKIAEWDVNGNLMR